MDKRKEKRFTTQLHVKINADSKTAWGILGDISENGLFIKTNRAINLNSVITIEIFMPDSRNSHLKGIVTRTVDLADAHRKYGLGVQLTHKDIKYKLFLEPFLYQPEPDTTKIGA
jgi:hypothetical protein